MFCLIKSNDHVVSRRGNKQVLDRWIMVTDDNPASTMSTATSWAVFAVPITTPCFPFHFEASVYSAECRTVPVKAIYGMRQPLSQRYARVQGDDVPGSDNLAFWVLDLQLHQRRLCRNR